MMQLANRVKGIKPSPTLAITAKANALKAKGIDVIAFAAGEPDFDTPQNIKDAAIKAINEGFTKYCPAGGTVELKEAIAEKLKKDNGLSYEPPQIIVSCGAKHSIYNVFQAILDEGTEIIVPAPYWVSYPPMAILAGAEPVIINAREEEGFKINPGQFKKAITKRTRAIVLNSPSNPTGATYSKKELEEIAEVAVKKNIVVVSDEIYEKLIYDDSVFTSIASLGKEVYDLTVTVNGVSKAYAMTGWRIGYAAGPPEIIDAMTKTQSQSTSNPTSIALKAALEALKGPQESVEAMKKEFAKRRDYMVERSNSIEGMSCLKPPGAFYVFPNVTGLLGKSSGSRQINNSTELTDYLLDSAKVAVVPGIEFGMEGYLRLSYATSLDNIKKGMDRIEEAVAELK
jgi:aspartate aminotransferase